MTDINYDGLPAGLRGGVQRYIEHGVPTGSFLEAVISNDLHASFACADEFNQRHMFEIVAWFHNECPHNAWGSAKAYGDWLMMHAQRRSEAGSPQPDPLVAEVERRKA